MELSFVLLIDFLGTFAFAISGIRLASAKKFDWFGAYVVGFVTAVGGGTLRDMMLGLTPFWMENIFYLMVTAFALLVVIFFSRYLVHMNDTIFIFDAIGIGLFTVVGMERSLGVGQPMWVAIIMGTLTAVAGGMIRDTLINEVPLVFRSEMYAVACIFGGFVYWLCVYLGVGVVTAQVITAIAIIVSRVLSAHYHFGLPTLNGEPTSGARLEYDKQEAAKRNEEA